MVEAPAQKLMQPYPKVAGYLANQAGSQVFSDLRLELESWDITHAEEPGDADNFLWTTTSGNGRK